MVSMKEEGLLRCRIIRDIAIASLWVVRGARLIPADGCTWRAALYRIMFRSLHPSFGHVVVAQLCKDRIVAYARISIKYEYYLKTKNIIITLDAI